MENDSIRPQESILCEIERLLTKTKSEIKEIGEDFGAVRIESKKTLGLDKFDEDKNNPKPTVTLNDFNVTHALLSNLIPSLNYRRLKSIRKQYECEAMTTQQKVIAGRSQERLQLLLNYEIEDRDTGEFRPYKKCWNAQVRDQIFKYRSNLEKEVAEVKRNIDNMKAEKEVQKAPGKSAMNFVKAKLEGKQSY